MHSLAKRQNRVQNYKKNRKCEHTSPIFFHYPFRMRYPTAFATIFLSDTLHQEIHGSVHAKLPDI